jgi:hypothetical protein
MIAMPHAGAFQILRWRTKGDAPALVEAPTVRPGRRGNRHGGDDESRREVVRSRGPQAPRAGDEAGRS